MLFPRAFRKGTARLTIASLGVKIAVHSSGAIEGAGYVATRR